MLANFLLSLLYAAFTKIWTIFAKSMLPLEIIASDIAPNNQKRPRGWFTRVPTNMAFNCISLFVVLITGGRRKKICDGSSIPISLSVTRSSFLSCWLYLFLLPRGLSCHLASIAYHLLDLHEFIYVSGNNWTLG